MGTDIKGSVGVDGREAWQKKGQPHLAHAQAVEVQSSGKSTFLRPGKFTT